MNELYCTTPEIALLWNLCEPYLKTLNEIFLITKVVKSQHTKMVTKHETLWMHSVGAAQ